MHIVFTGGGTAGHVIPNLSIIEAMKKEEKNVQFSYIGSKDGIEKELVERQGIAYHGVPNGKLRRYFSWQNFIDPFKVLGGIFHSLYILRKIKPAVLFSKGGFVAVPPTIAAFFLKIPVIVHESDMTPGMANKLSFPFARYICATFESTMTHLPEAKAVHTGAFIRPSLFEGRKEEAFQYLPTFTEETKSGEKKVLLVMGGSQGSAKINEVIRFVLPILLEKYAVIHLCGMGNLDASLEGKADYQQLEYADSNLADLLAMADLVVSRAGATAIFEFLALQKTMLLIPLSKQASRGDQILNAKEFLKRGYANVLFEEDVNSESLVEAVYQLEKDSEVIQHRQAEVRSTDAIAKILELFELLAEKKKK